MWQILTIILGSGLVSALATHFLTTGVAEKKFRREKLEQLYLVARKYCELSVASTDRPFSPDRRKEYEQTRDNCWMLTHLYFPDLLPAFSTFHDDFERFLDGDMEEQDMQRSGEKFVALIVSTAQKMNRPWYSRLTKPFSSKISTVIRNPVFKLLAILFLGLIGYLILIFLWNSRTYH